MPLPEWAYPPVPGAEHGDNYSALDVVWTHPDGHVTVQRPPEVEPAEPEPLEAMLVDDSVGEPSEFIQQLLARNQAADRARAVAVPVHADPPPILLTDPAVPAEFRYGPVDADYDVKPEPAQPVRWRRFALAAGGGGVIAAGAVVAAHLLR